MAATARSLSPSVPESTEVIVYSADWCPYCDRAKNLLRERRIAFEEINLDRVPGFRARLVELTGRATVPQILIGGEPIGGFTELRQLDRAGRLADLAA
jgi:glutaredoxin 3